MVAMSARLCLPPAAGCRGLTLPLGLGLRLMSKKGGQFPIVSWRRCGRLALTKGGKISATKCPPKLCPPAFGLRGMVETSAGPSGNWMSRNNRPFASSSSKSKVMAKISFGTWLPSVPDASVLP